MSNCGWIKVHRSLIENPKRVRSSRLALWLYILLSVNHAPGKTYLCGKEIDLKPGQGVFSTPDLAKKLCEPVSVIRRSLEWFESEQQIEQRKTNQGTVITVLNWDKYQAGEQPSEQRENNERTTSEQRVNNLPIIKECNNGNNGKNTTPAEEEPQQSEYKTFTEKWNALPLHNIVSLKGKRLDMLRARVKEYGMDEVLKAIDITQRSPFLLGQNSSRWQITVDWFLKPNNFPKVLEGNYLPKDVEPAQAENKFNKVLEGNQNKQPGEDILFMDIVRAYKEAKTKGETRTLQEYAVEYRQRKRGEVNGAGNTEGVV